MFVTKGYGFTVDDIDWSCPADLEPYSKAHNLELKEMDSYMHKAIGNYGISAMACAIELNFAKNPKGVYLDKPLFYDMSKEENNEYSESKEEVAIFEMKQRINLLRGQGLPESPK